MARDNGSGRFVREAPVRFNGCCPWKIPQELPLSTPTKKNLKESVGKGSSRGIWMRSQKDAKAKTSNFGFFFFRCLAPWLFVPGSYLCLKKSGEPAIHIHSSTWNLFVILKHVLHPKNPMLSLARTNLPQEGRFMAQRLLRRTKPSKRTFRGRLGRFQAI